MKSPFLRTFFITFLLCCCVGGLLVAFAAIEWNTRRTLYGEISPGVTYSLQNGVPVITDDEGEVLFSLSLRQQQGLWMLLPPSARTAFALLRGEAAALQRLLNWGSEKQKALLGTAFV